MPDNNTNTPTTTDVTDASSAPTPTPDTTPEPTDPVTPVEPSVPVEPTPPTNPAAASAPAVPSPVVSVDAPAPLPANPDAGDTSVIAEVVRHIGESKNVLVALSSDPSVDEMSAAIGLSLFLDKLGKRATAIYSGSTPNALEFLKPEETFEPSVDSLQDFVIALNKEKADHLRYKLDGDFVKIYITPYRTKISEEDLDFSYGDFNIDLVLALDVANGVDLDSALREHGRIMHDAVIIDITTGKPGKLGEIEWTDKSASSVSEMIAKLLYSINSKVEIEAPEATAFLTGIVAATNRFSNAKTTPETMQLASRLMESGANQQLISKNITPDVENEMFSLASSPKSDTKKNTDPTKLEIEHDYSDRSDIKANKEAAKDKKEKEDKEDEEVKEEKEETSSEDSALLDDLQAAAASLSQAGVETTPDTSDTPIEIDSSKTSMPSEAELSSDSTPEAAEISTPASEPEPAISSESSTESSTEPSTEPVTPSDISPTLPPVVDDTSSTEPSAESTSEPALEPDHPEKVIQPSDELSNLVGGAEDTNKYGQMLEDALEDSSPAAAPAITPVATPDSNPATTGAPAVPANPEINGVPEINYMPMPGEEVLPPPPTPPIDMDSAMPAPEPATDPDTSAVPAEPITPAAPVEEPTPAPLGAQPAMQDQVYAPQVADPSAFKIPGM